LIKQSWLCLTVVLHLFSRQVVGRSMKSQMISDVAIQCVIDGGLEASTEARGDDSFQPR